MEDEPLPNEDDGARDSAMSDEGHGPDDVLMPGLDLPASDAENAAQNSAGYQVLARKYRPTTFEDLIGQEPMVKTLTNAFAAGRIAHAYMLTGVRGIGKTTTARLIARALNYETDAVDAPSISLDPPGRHCEAIAKSSHVDVMEMDAASRTGVGDIREILDGVRYAPVSARYKVYVIDEVHMLSTSAFNALLKTLEEPPEHAKFIFATTEIRKVPVTVLSRCQRFDLKRIDRDVLVDHLDRICGLENARVDRDGLALIARAAEGSVRDALSLLDQAIVQGADSDGPVSALQIRDMLGLADRARVLDLLEHALSAKTKDALDELAALYAAGGDPVVVTRDLLDYVHAASRVKAAGREADLGEAAETAARLGDLADRLTLAQLTRFWKLLLTGLDDVRNAPDAMAAAEMTVLRLIAAAQLPSPEDAARMLAGGAAPAAAAASAAAAPAAPSAASEPESPAAPEPASAVPSGLKPDMAPEATSETTPETAPETDQLADEPVDGPATFEQLIALLAEKRSVDLRIDIERYVRPVSFKPGAMTFEPAEGAPSDLAPRLARRLLEWTGARWMILADANARGGETWQERQRRAKREQLDAAARDPGVAAALRAFPGAEIVAVHDSDEAADRPGEADGQTREKRS